LENEINNITISNCKNIAYGKIIIKNECLNIKFAANGTGKSTIAKAILLTTSDKDLSELHSYGTEDEPALSSKKPLGKVCIFDEDFVNTIVFLEREVIGNSFEIFIKTPDYDERLENVNNGLKALRFDIGNDEEISSLNRTFAELSAKIQFNVNGSIKKTAFFKSIISNHNFCKIPENLHKYRPFFESEYTVDWVDWKNKGYEFDDQGECPFCTEPFIANYQMEKETFTSQYSKASSQHLKELLGFLRSLKEYISPEKFKLLDDCIKSTTDEDTIRTVFGKFMEDINYVKKKIDDITKFDSFGINREEISDLDNMLNRMKVDPDILDMLHNDKTNSIINNINSKIDSVIKDVDYLKKEIGELNGIIQNIAKNTKKDINGFLESAGINYEMDIVINNESDSNTILRYKDRNNEFHEVDKIKEHLSWGERNAFALVLFMHFSLSQNADLIILDDPISSFDSDKKYAIVNRLFKNHGLNKSFYKQTVLMMTHDLEPIIDFIVTNKPTGGFVCAHHLQNKNGTLSETCITDEDLLSQVLILGNVIKDNQIKELIRIIALRKYIEITKQKTEEENAYNLISSILKFKNKPDKKINQEEYIDMNEEEITSGTKFIVSWIPTFSYTKILKNLINSKSLVKLYKDESCNYFKIQLFRLLLKFDNNDAKINDENLLKYVNETYHIENDYLYNLDFRKFDMIPEYIIKKCDEFILKQYK